MSILEWATTVLGSRRIPVSALLFLLLFSVYSFTMAGWIQYGDEVEKYRVAQSIVDRHDFSFRPTAQRNETGVGGRTYSIYELGQTLIEVPFYALGRTVYALVPLADVNQLAQLVVGFLNPLFTALTAVLVYQTCLSLGFANSMSLGLSLIFGVATIAWPFTKGYTREPLLTFFLLLSIYTLYRFQQTNRWPWVVAAGIASGYLVFTKFIHGIVMPVLIVYLIAVVWQKLEANAGTRRRAMATVRALLLFLLPAIVFLSLQGLYAFARFGTLTAGIAGTKNNPVDWIWMLLQDGHPDQALVGLLLSPEKSMFLYSPPVLLGLITWFRWVRLQAREALLFMALFLVEFASVVGRPDWDGGSWWGPRYLVQVTPLFIIPLGALATSPRYRRLWRPLVLLFAGAGLFVQIAGAFANTRDYLDATGRGITLAGQLGFLAHGALDSLFLYLSLVGFPVSINPYGIVLVLLAALAGLLLAARKRSGDQQASGSWRTGWSLIAVALVLQSTAFVLWVIAPYPQVLAAKGNSRFAAGNLFLAARDRSMASAMYIKAIELGTGYTSVALDRLHELAPRAPSTVIAASDFLGNVEMPDDATVTQDDRMTLTGKALRFTLPPGKDAIARATSDPIPVSANTTYALSGWIKTQAIYGTGSGIVALYEDDGAWKSARGIDVVSSDETNGWLLFQKTITTLPTTKRLFIAAGLWNTYGTFWVDGLELAETAR